MQKYTFFAYAFFLLTFIGCASTPRVSPPSPAKEMPGIYHRVQKHQTLWRISQMYNVDLDQLAQINRISDTSSIEVNQLIFIPSRKKPQLPPLTIDAGNDDFIWPLKGKVISSFGQIFNNMINKGLNIRGPANAQVVAARAGKVVFYGEDLSGFGRTVIIDHGDGFLTVYARNAEVFIRPGDSVSRGSIIARVGSWGRDKNAYLHFEIRKGSVSQNPFFYLPG